MFGFKEIADPGATSVAAPASEGVRTTSWVAATLSALAVAAAASGPGAHGLPPLPAHVLTLRATGELEVRDSADGHVTRTVATLTPLTGLLSRQIAVTPDGRTAFVERSTAFRPTKACPRPHPAAPQYDVELVSVDIDSGRVRSLGRRRMSPAVSPAGDTLAYNRYHCRLGGRTMVRDLDTGDEYAVRLTDDDGRLFVPMTFASEEHLDAFASYDATVTRFRITQPDPQGRVAGAQIVVPGSNVIGRTCGASTFVGASRDGSERTEPGPWPNWELAAFDLTTGAVTQRFGELANHSFVHVADVDASCTHALVTSRQNSAEDPRAQSPLVLARWSVGGAPVPLGEDVIAATWMP